jgi:L-alanine-DL-glutamate epimerase-like enolase superfamily enzyme
LKITKIETVYKSHLLMLRIHTEDGLIGCGETYYAPSAVSALIHDWMSDYLIDKNALDIEKHWRFFYQRFINFGGKGAEIRAISAIDLALWDIFGQMAGLPIWQLLGGETQSELPTYNSAGGTGYGPLSHASVSRKKRETLLWPGYGSPGVQGPFEDNWASIHRPVEYAKELIREGYKGMKMWLLDPLAHKSNGPLYLSYNEIKSALKPIFDIREAVGFDIEIILDGHGFFQWPTALRIAELLREIKPLWLEDVLRVDNIELLKRFREEGQVPIAVSEMFTTRDDYRRILENQVADYVMIDPTWVGGISETRRITEMAIPHNIPVTMHDCTGPLTLLAGLHVGIACNNVVFQESVRAHLNVVYNDLIDQRITTENGSFKPPQIPGIGAAWLNELFSQTDSTYRASV